MAKKSRGVGRKFGKRTYFPSGRTSKNKKTANNTAKNLRKKGLLARVVKGQKNKKPIYKIYVSSTAT